MIRTNCMFLFKGLVAVNVIDALILAENIR